MRLLSDNASPVLFRAPRSPRRRSALLVRSLKTRFRTSGRRPSAPARLPCRSRLRVENQHPRVALCLLCRDRWGWPGVAAVRARRPERPACPARVVSGGGVFLGEGEEASEHGRAVVLAPGEFDRQRFVRGSSARPTGGREVARPAFGGEGYDVVAGGPFGVVTDQAGDDRGGLEAVLGAGARSRRLSALRPRRSGRSSPRG